MRNKLEADSGWSTSPAQDPAARRSSTSRPQGSQGNQGLPLQSNDMSAATSRGII